MPKEISIPSNGQITKPSSIEEAAWPQTDNAAEALSSAAQSVDAEAEISLRSMYRYVRNAHRSTWGK